MNPKQNIIAIANQKGGVGKTTTAVNVAAYLAKSGQSVLLVDLDPQGNSSSGLAIRKEALSKNLYDVLVRDVAAESVIVPTEYERLFVLPANSALAAAEVDLASRIQREYVLRKHLLKLDFDVIIIDCPPSLGLLTINGLVAASWVLIPTQAEYYALEGLSQLLGTIKRVRSALNPNLKLLGVVATMFDSRNSLSTQVVAELKKHFGELVFDVKVARNIRLAEAPSHGKPIMYYDRFCRGAFAYKKLTKEIVTRVKSTK